MVFQDQIISAQADRNHLPSPLCSLCKLEKVLNFQQPGRQETYISTTTVLPKICQVSLLANFLKATKILFNSSNAIQCKTISHSYGIQTLNPPI